MAKLDSAVLALLKLDPASTTISSAGGGGMSSARTSKITTTTSTQDGNSTTRSFFMKSAPGPAAAIMFAGEHASLSAIHSIVPSLCPQSYGHGAFESGDTQTHFLVTDFLDLSSRRGGSSSSSSKAGKPMTLAQKLAKLHSTPAPIPEGYSTPQFGFPVPTCCGDTAQDNTFTSSWAEFFAERRLRFILRQSAKKNGKDQELEKLVERTCEEVVPRLIGDDHLNNGRGVTPVVVHGDLWSGNASRGKVAGMEGDEDMVFDSSACYAHSEFELGIMRMFGGFSGGGFLEEYHRIVPKTEPREEYEDRVRLYELYHHLNHHALFGGGYRGGAVGIMRGLLGRYGDGDGEGKGRGGRGEL